MYTLIAGDTSPTVFVLKDATGTPVNINGYSFVFKLGYPTPVTRNGAIVDAAAGKLQFPWQAGDLRAGIVSAEILITTPDTKERTQKLGGINILPRIA